VAVLVARPARRPDCRVDTGRQRLCNHRGASVYRDALRKPNARRRSGRMVRLQTYGNDSTSPSGWRSITNQLAMPAMSERPFKVEQWSKGFAGVTTLILVTAVSERSARRI